MSSLSLWISSAVLVSDKRPRWLVTFPISSLVGLSWPASPELDSRFTGTILLPCHPDAGDPVECLRACRKKNSHAPSIRLLFGQYRASKNRENEKQKDRATAEPKEQGRRLETCPLLKCAPSQRPT